MKARVQNKGHFVEPTIVVRRYHKSMQNLNEIIPHAINVGVGFQKRAIETNLGLVMEMF